MFDLIVWREMMQDYSRTRAKNKGRKNGDKPDVKVVPTENVSEECYGLCGEDWQNPSPKNKILLINKAK